MPLAGVQTYPSLTGPVENSFVPAITSPLAETALAWLEPAPGRKPSPIMPVDLVHRKASNAIVDRLSPTTTRMSAEVAKAALEKKPPCRSPRPLMPAVAVQRNASLPELERLSPTTTRPFHETPCAWLEKESPGRSPSGTKSARAEAAAATTRRAPRAKRFLIAFMTVSRSFAEKTRIR